LREIKTNNKKCYLITITEKLAKRSFGNKDTKEK